MRSYYAHLEALKPLKAQNAMPHPNFRSSAIFPAIQRPDISMRLLFMGYWLLKRKIDKLASIISVRSQDGTLISRKELMITEAKTYRIELADFLEEAGISKGIAFEGSFEIEFFATENLVFPFPAVVVNYYGDNFSSVVHTAQRVYNDFEDMERNSQTLVPEAGFNIHVNADCEPFIALINGILPQENAEIDFHFFNADQDVLKYAKKLGFLKPYESLLLFPARELDLKSFLDGKVGSCQVQFAVNWIFPRLLVGNHTRSPEQLAITHTYYDCSKACTPKDYWTLPEESKDEHPAALMFPLLMQSNHYTNLYFYPIYSPSTLAIDVEFYSDTGSLLAKKDGVLILKSPREEFNTLYLASMAKELCPANSGMLGVRVIARPIEGSLLPARIKVGFDVGHGNSLPCNICMNLQVYAPALASKTSSFKWLPLLADQPNASIWIMNASPEQYFTRTATIDLTVYREKDTETLKRSFSLAPNGYVIIRPDEEIASFLDETIGWVTVVTNNSYLTTYYFAENPSGFVGGDHGF